MTTYNEKNQSPLLRHSIFAPALQNQIAESSSMKNALTVLQALINGGLQAENLTKLNTAAYIAAAEVNKHLPGSTELLTKLENLHQIIASIPKNIAPTLSLINLANEISNILTDSHSIQSQNVKSSPTKGLS